MVKNQENNGMEETGSVIPADPWDFASSFALSAINSTNDDQAINIMTFPFCFSFQWIRTELYVNNTASKVDTSKSVLIFFFRKHFTLPNGLDERCAQCLSARLQ